MFLARRIPRQVSHMRLQTAFLSSQSSSAPSSETPAISRAEKSADSIINFFPGSTPFAKTGSLLAAASLATFAVSKEIYVFDAEFMEMMCIFGAYYIWYKGGKDSALSYFKEKRETITNVLSQARQDHRAVVEERINHIGKLNDIVPVTEALYDTSKEIAQLEAQVYELEQKIKVKNQIRSTLDGWVRYEAHVREQEQKQLADTVIEKVKQSLKDSKFQNALLQQTLADFDKIASK